LKDVSINGSIILKFVLKELEDMKKIYLDSTAVRTVVNLRVS